MIPGPTTAKKTRKCLRHFRKRLGFTGSHFAGRASRSASSKSSRGINNLSAVHHYFENVIRGDYAKKMALRVYDGQGDKVVFVKQVHDRFLVRAGFDGNDWVGGKFFKRGARVG